MLKLLSNAPFRSFYPGKVFAIALSFAVAFLSSASISFAAPADQAATPTRVAASSCTTQAPGIQVVVGNPSPGDLLIPGNSIVINGVAFDPAATQGTGIDRVSAYLGNRDTGGVFLGNAALGLPNPLASAGSQFATAGFSIRTSMLPLGSGGRDLFVYAHSSVSQKEGIVSVPVFLGAVPTPVKGQVPTPVLPTPVPCTPTPVAASTSTPVPAAAPAAAATSTPIGPPATLAPLPTLPPPVAPAAGPPAAAPATATARPATAPAAAAAAAGATTAPRGGGIPPELGVGLLALGALVVSGGMALRRRERGASQSEGDPPTVD